MTLLCLLFVPTDRRLPVADPGFPRGGGANPTGGQHTILPNFPHAPLDLPLFTTAFWTYLQLIMSLVFTLWTVQSSAITRLQFNWVFKKWKYDGSKQFSEKCFSNQCDTSFQIATCTYNTGAGVSIHRKGWSHKIYKIGKLWQILSDHFRKTTIQRIQYLALWFGLLGDYVGRCFSRARLLPLPGVNLIDITNPVATSAHQRYQLLCLLIHLESTIAHI